LNAANEVAVDAFLNRRTSYTNIARVIESTLEWQAGQASNSLSSLEEIVAADQMARTFAGNSCLLSR
jgi:1-deoxy-D-xylulose-5-phosphate reductoisomerase